LKQKPVYGVIGIYIAIFEIELEPVFNWLLTYKVSII
jgi:hypothetical protein